MDPNRDYTLPPPDPLGMALNYIIILCLEKISRTLRSLGDHRFCWSVDLGNPNAIYHGGIQPHPPQTYYDANMNAVVYPTMYSPVPAPPQANSHLQVQPTQYPPSQFHHQHQPAPVVVTGISYIWQKCQIHCSCLDTSYNNQPSQPVSTTQNVSTTRTTFSIEDSSASFTPVTTKAAPQETQKQGNIYIGDDRVYPSVECISGRWLMWDAIASAALVLTPDKRKPSMDDCCDVMGKACLWVLYVILLPLTIVMMVVYALVGLICDFIYNICWLITLGFCFTRCKPKCVVKRVPPYKWVQYSFCCCICGCGCE